MKTKLFYRIFFLTTFVFTIVSCTSSMIPDKAQAVDHFEAKRYLGTWYEIARFDFHFEKDLDNTSAQYSFNSDGTIAVLNSGFNVKSKEWKEAKGKAKFRGDNSVAALKVSFFGPFYSGYNVIALDADYKYALVAGKNLDYLWILSREKSIPEDIKQEYLAIATAVGYDVSRFIWVNHDKEDNPFLK